MQLLAHAFPGAVIVDRSTRAGRPDSSGYLYVDHPRHRTLALPGLVIVPRAGPGPLPGDQALDRFSVSSTARGLLDNLAGGGGRCLSREEIEAWITEIATRHGEPRLNALRDQARDLAVATGREDAFARLSTIIGAAMSTGPVDAVVSHALQASAAGHPYDHERLALFRAAAAYLADQAPASRPDLPDLASRRRLLPFYEAYFSNDIEGTEFTLDEAAAIIFDGVIPAERPEDAHDVLGTYRIVADPAEMARTPGGADDLVELLQQRHATIMEGRPDKGPGYFKTRSNRAGATVFVAPRLVEGTLRAGFDVGRSLLGPFARAVFTMFLVAEVHPFADGNGRVARVMMNAELAAAHEGRIIIPTVYRSEYLSALKAATHNAVFAPIAAVLAFAQRYTAQVNFETRATAERDLARTNALVDPQSAEDSNIRLLLPRSLDRVGTA
jgi:Fic family protein